MSNKVRAQLKISDKRHLCLIPTRVLEFRAFYREKFLPRVYFGYLHLGYSLSILFLGAALPVFYIKKFNSAEYVLIFTLFFVNNLIVYLLHRFPLHHHYKKLSYTYNVHTQRHHRFYTHEATTPESHKDFHMVLFPAVVITGFSFIVLPILFAFTNFLFGFNTACIVTAVSSAYFFLYEVLHFVYHLRENHPVFRFKPISFMKEHHTVHHNPKYMGVKNFDIVFPFFDYVFRTKL